MTVQEAKKIMEMFLHKQCDLQRTEFAYSQNEVWAAVKMSADALEEVEQYRALGTPTQILERIGGLDVELGKYHCLGTVEELKEAREKQISDKWIECPYADLIMCPSCNAEFSTIDNCTEQFEYCPKCGKRLE